MSANLTRANPTEFQQLIRETSENFVNREFVFAAINEFLQKCDRLEKWRSEVECDRYSPKTSSTVIITSGNASIDKFCPRSNF